MPYRPGCSNSMSRSTLSLRWEPTPFGLESWQSRIGPTFGRRNILNERLLRMTFQSAKEWDTGFALLGVKSGLTNAGRALNPLLTKAQVETRLNQLSHRRNCIVHEGDLRRLVRPQKISRSRLTRPEVDGDLQWIERFLSAVDGLI